MLKSLSDAEKRELRGFGVRLGAAALILWLLLGVVYGIAPQPNGDMTPTAEGGDLLFFYRLQSVWRTGDLAVVEKDGQTLVGRVAARGGDTVEITQDGRLVVNGSTVVESRVHTPTPPYPSGIAYPLTLKEEELFILADRREGGVDSRSYGPATPGEVKGKVLLILRRGQL